MRFSQNIDGFDSQGSYLELLQLHKENPWEKFVIFTIYQNYAIGFKVVYESSAWNMA